jgi:outer membrane PBP1 activator LpoA protein
MRNLRARLLLGVVLAALAVASCSGNGPPTDVDETPQTALRAALLDR